MTNTNSLIERTKPLFEQDLHRHSATLSQAVAGARILVIGGAGSIGQAVVKELFARNPRALHVVDLSENGLVELVRDIRSSLGYIEGDFRTFAVDYGQPEFEALVDAHGPYDYVANLAALKHVRSERDPFTLMRLTRVNVLNTVRSIELSVRGGAKKYFAVSSDKAANPFNMMGASKRIMEMYLATHGDAIPVSTARFANVAFSNGSLLDGFRYRLRKNQPLAAPSDVKRYFVTEEEAGRLCLLSIILGNNRDIFFPKAPEELHLVSFADIARRFLLSQGFEPHLCSSEEEAREYLQTNPGNGRWPLFTFTSDTTGEKPFEEFYTNQEDVDWNRFSEVGIVQNDLGTGSELLDRFYTRINDLLAAGTWTKDDLVEAYSWLLPHFAHRETGRSLDERM
ncbi:UDP-N-acetylglucosamine 4,6-dehydratase [Alkalispirochaeta alkalica]|uniref:UDP-N-acetylglucosamine 4,6-dehydratase n=1 Tax=Alkalispirochaeta alkalica TaxID=46356 RepID=UPI00036FFEB7|nr:UDP-N-acetylglucosamine 4,6-dehydratase [Alkalispirochaeta alkalica]